ncbi:hypothetical protein [Tessaracoccus coleopterorum]|uniref:hypothetical protein n=1 Tax=Tessaracoccus coleopterorum TaxID=2714950 RepID=UPI0018D33B91|nr:hypothetical protein [Tessaracoccus coleopterorum]
MLPRQAEHIFFLTGLFPELDAADRLRAAAAQVLGRQPETVGEAWSRELGLGLPEDYWSVSLSLDPVVPEKEEDDPLAGLVAAGSTRSSTWRSPIITVTAPTGASGSGR